MLHILPQERFATAASPDNIGMDAPSIEDLRRTHGSDGKQALDDGGDYEFVLGRRQVASLSFVVLVLISLFAGIAYLAGRSAVAHVNSSAPVTIEAAAGHPTPPPPTPATPQAPVQPQATVEIPPTSVISADLYAEPIAGQIYIQTAATDRGIARIMAEGIRTHGLPSVVAPGPNEKIFRVLVGPFPNMPAYQHAKEMLDQIGVSAFARFQK
jgi:cell division septation protein DedD